MEEELKNNELHKAVEDAVQRRLSNITASPTNTVEADIKRYKMRANQLDAIRRRREEEGREEFTSGEKNLISKDRAEQAEIEKKYGIDREAIRAEVSAQNRATTTPKAVSIAKEPDKITAKEPIKNTGWGPLAPEEIDDAIQQGFYEYTPGDGADFDMFLQNKGYNPQKLKEQYDKELGGKNQYAAWGPLAPEEIDDAIQQGFYEYTPGDAAGFDVFLRNHGYNPQQLRNDLDNSRNSGNNQQQATGVYPGPRQNNNSPYSRNGGNNQQNPGYQIVHVPNGNNPGYQVVHVPNGNNPGYQVVHVPNKNNPTPPGPGGNNPTPPGPGRNNQTPPGPGGNNPTPPGPGGNNLPIRTFWEIYNDTHKEHCGTFRRTIFQMAQAPVFGIQGKDKDGLQKFLHAGLDIVSLGVIPALKLVARGVNAIAGTNRIYQEEYARIAALSPEEFEILVSSADEINETQRVLNRPLAKLPDDRFYLDAGLMKQAKVNDLYLDAVSAVLKKRSAEKIEIFEKQIFNNENRIKELEERQNNLSQTEQSELRELKEQTLAIKAHIPKVSNKVDAFREVTKLKTGSFKNIAGWIVAKNNPDNREMVAQMARESHELAEAFSRGDRDAVYECDHKMDQILLDQTRIRQIGLGRNDLIDRGNASLASETKTVQRNGRKVEEQFIHYGEFLDKGPQTKTRDFISFAAAGTALGNMVYTHMVRKGIDVHNTDVQITNNANQHIHYKGQQQYEGQVRFTDQETIDNSVNSYVDSKISGGHAIGEYSNLDESGMEAGGGWHSGLNTSSYKLRDDTLHEATHNAVDNATSAGNNLGKIDVADQYFDPIASHASEVFSKTTNNQIFDYYGIQQALGGPATTGAFKKLISDIGDGTVSFSGVVDYSGTASGMQAGLMNQVSYIPSMVTTAAIGRLILESAAKDAEARASAELQAKIQKNQARVARQAQQQQNQQQQNQQQQQGHGR